MSRRHTLFVHAAILLFFAGAGAEARGATDRAAIVKRAKGASAYLFVNAGAGREMASAFCVHSSGVFVTCKHVIDAAHGADKYNLVLNSGDDGERVISAHVLRISDDADLAILKADQPGNYDALQIGDSDALVETDEVIAFGFPFGQNLSADAQSNPNITVSSGHVTSLRKRKGERDKIQLDASLNPGNSGGALVNADGLVVGVVSSGIRGAALNFATPASKLRSLLSKPVVSLAPTTLPYDHRSDLAVFTIHVDPLLPEITQLEVALVLGESDAARSFAAIHGADGAYIAKAVPIQTADGPMRLAVTAQFKSGSLTAETLDRDVKVGDASMHLRDIRVIDRSSGASVIQLDGRSTTGPITGMNAIDLDFGDAHATLDLSHAVRIELKQPDQSPHPLPYRIIVRSGAASVSELSGAIEFTGLPHPAVVSGTTGHQTPGKTNLSADRVVVKLPGELDDVQAAASGHLLVLHLAKLHKLALFDTAAASIVRYIPIAADHMLYAAGDRKLVVVLPDDNIIERFDLATGAKELAVQLPPGAAPASIAAGYASNGPICLFSTGWTFLDMETLRPIPLTQEGGGGFDSGGLCVRAAADGSAFAAWAQGVSPTGVRLLSIDGHRLIYHYEHTSASPLLPSFDGSQLFTAMGILKPSQMQIVPTGNDRSRAGTLIPSYNPAYYVGIDRDGGARQRPNDEAHPKITIYSSVDHRNLITLSDIEESGPSDAMRWDNIMTPEKRLHVMPDQGVIITIPATNDQLVLHRFDLVKQLDDAGVDYLFTESLPPRSVARGLDFSYQIAVRSKRGRVVFHLDSGPDNMKISPTGLVTWHCPETGSDKNASVIISIKDDSGQEIFHNLALAIQ